MMDLKSMLNDASNQRQPPRLHTPQSSYDHGIAIANANANANPIAIDAQPERPSSYPPPHPSSDQRQSANGSYFNLQSPHQQQSAIAASASTPTIASQPSFAQSPGPHGPVHTPRDNNPPPHHYHPPFVPSPSNSAPYPPTPGSVQYQQTPSSASTYHHPGGPSAFNLQSPRDEIAVTNGHAHSNSRNISPHAQFHPTPATPLGPPVTYPRPSPHAHRPLSQGQEGYRRLSVGSVGSSHSREYIQSGVAPQPIHSRSGSIQRTFSGDVRERERSIESVSPKTIPKAAPKKQRQASTGRYSDVPVDIYPLAPSQPVFAPSVNATAQSTPDRVLDVLHNDATPKSSSASVEPKGPPQYQPARPSPGAGPANNMTPQSTHSPLSQQMNSPAATQTSLKRNASHLSSVPSTPQPPRKRPRPNDFPLWAESARDRPVKFIRARPPATPVTTVAMAPTPPLPAPPQPSASYVKSEPPVKQEIQTPHVTNGQGQSQTPSAAHNPDEPRWEVSITTVMPYEDLTKRVCDWIVHWLLNATPPSNGAMFEIEAKVGAIFDEQTDMRLQLPVETETVFNREKYRGRTSFKSSMNIAQHKQINAFLNGLVEESMRESQHSDRAVIAYSHPHEYDEFYELSEEGRRNLPQSIVHWMNPRHKPRVRRTIDEETRQVKAQIIKSRIADLEVYNPQSDFDYRISISIESPWEGDPNWLSEMTEESRDRQKDRMSYRHMAYQVDLTQVSYQNTPEKEHELEVEISTEMVRRELDNLKMQRPNRYEPLIRGLIDNMRILCRRATVGRPR